MIIRIRDNWGKEYRVEDSEVAGFAEEMKAKGRKFAPVRTLVNPKTGEEWEGTNWHEKQKEGLQPWEARAMDDEKTAFEGRIAEGWQYKQWEEPGKWDAIKGFFDTENFTDPTGEQGNLEFHAKNVTAGVGSAVVAGVTGLANAIQGTVLNAAAFTSRALGAEGAADVIADVRKETSENIRNIRDKATDAILEGLDAKGMQDARELVDTGLDVVEGFSGLYGLGASVGGATKGVVKLAGSMGKTVDAARVGGAVLAGQMGADAYEHALEELEMQEEMTGKEISGFQETMVAGARAAMSAATSKLFGKIAGIGIPPETARKVVQQSLGRSTRKLVQEMGEFAAINDLNVLADEASRWAADVDRLDPETGVMARLGSEALHGAGMVAGMKSQKILKGGWNAMMPMRVETFTKSMEAMKRAELGALEAAAKTPETIVAVTPGGVGVRADGGFVRSAEGEVVSPDGCVLTAEGKVRTIGAGRCGEREGGEYGIKVEKGRGDRRFGEDLTENACALVALGEEGMIETRKIPLKALSGEVKAGENGIRLRLKEDGSTELVTGLPETEQNKPVVVLEHADGTFSLVTGRKRVAAGKTAGNGEIEAIVIREKDGWTAETAKVVDVVDNLMKGSPVSDIEAISAANALEIGYKRAAEWGLTVNENVAAAFRLRENATPQLVGMLAEGSATLEAADAIARNANKRNMPGASEEQIAAVQTELVGKMGLGTPAEIDAVCRKLRETDMSIEESMDPMARQRKLDEAIAAAEKERLEEAAKKNGVTPEQEAKVEGTPVEKEDGTLTTIREVERGVDSGELKVERGELKGGIAEKTKLTVKDGKVTSARFPEVEVVRSEEDNSVAVRGLKAEEMLKPENREAVTDLLEEMAKTVGEFAIAGEAELAAAHELLKARATKRRIEAEQTRRESITEVLGVLAESGLAKGVHTDQESFDARLKQGKGIKTWLTSTDEVWGFTDGSEIWLNPKTARLETPIHEYGHLGIEMCKKVNRDVYDRGVALAKETELFKEISENDAYRNDSEAARAEEVLATIIGKRGEEALKGAPETLRARVKEWLVDFWKAFGQALGLREITPEQAANMTLEQVADAIRAEMMSGKRFGEGGVVAAKGNSAAGAEEVKLSVGGIFTGTAADYANRSREGGKDDGPSLLKIGTGEGVYKTSIDTKNPKTKDGRNTVIFRRDPRECDALLVESETIKAVEKALPENIKTGDKSIKYTESERIAVRNFVKEKAKAQRGEVQNPEFGEIHIGLDFVKEVQAHAISTAREIAAVSSAREIAAKMRHFAASPNEEIKRGKNKYIEYGLATFEFQGERYLVMGEVGIRNNAKPYYDQRIVAKIKAETSPSLHAHIETESAFDEVYDNRFRILMQAAQEGNPDIRYSAKRQELPKGDGEDVASWLLNGRLRLADDAKYQPAATEAAGQTVKYTPAADPGISKPVGFSMSMLVDLYRSMRKNPALPKVLTRAREQKRKWLGRMTKGSEVELNPEMFGIVSKSDEARIKAELKAEGRFRNEDPGWNLRHSKKQNDNERIMGEMLLEDRLRSLSEDRVRGKAGGENAAAIAVMAHEIGVLAMQLPKTSGESDIITSMRTLGDGIKEFFEKDARQFESVRAAALGDKLRNAKIEETNFAKGQALRAVSWWRGYESRNGEAEAYFRQNDRELYAETLGMFLAAPEALRQRAPKAFNLIVEKVAENQRLLEAYNRITESHNGTGPAETVMRKIEAQWTHEAQMEIAKLEKELDKPLGTWIQRPKRRLILNLHAKDGLAVSVVGDGLKQNVAEARKAYRRGDISKEEYEAVRKDAKDTLRDLKLGVLKKQRGGGLGRVYALDFLNKVMGDIERDGIDLADFRRYLKAQRVIETQGRAMDFGMSPREAQKVLDGLKEKFGDGGMMYRKIEAAAMRYHAVREKNVLDNEDIVEAFGRARIDAWKRNVHYVRTQRTISAEEAASHGETLAELKKADPLTELGMLMDLHHRKHRSTHGDTFMEPLVGSLKATEDPLQATLANDMRMMAFARRNHLIVQLADIAKREGLEGWKEIHDRPGEIRLDRSERYGSISFLRDGERKLLIMPKVVAEGFKYAASDVAGMVKANRMLSAVLTQYSARFAIRNLSRNRASTEINVPWMGESRFVRGARFAGMGPAARIAEILMERALVRLPDRYSRNAAANLLWGEHTNLYWMSEATRIAELMHNPKGFRELAEKADEYAANGEYGKAQKVLEDLEKAREIMKHPLFAGHWEMTKGTTERTDLDEVFRALDIRTKVEEVPLRNLKKFNRMFIDAANTIKRFNTFEESRIKIVSILAAERAKARAQERGKAWKYDERDVDYITATMAGSPRYENRGRWMNVLEAIPLGPFVNVSMKGALRTFESMKIDPAAWWTKAAQRYAGRMAEVALWSGAGYAFVAQVARKLFEDDDEAQRVIDGFERFGKRMARARACTSDYRIRNYDVMPLGLYGKYSSFGICLPRGDEDRLFTPMTDLFTQYLLGSETAQEAGLQKTMEGAYEGMFQTLAATATTSGLVPDFMRGSMIWNLGRDVIYSWFNNPYNTFTQRPLYDENLWKERWNRPGEFWEATLKQAWNDVGGQVVLPATTWDEDEGEVPDDGKWVMSMADDKEQMDMPIGGKTVFRALHYVPLASAALSGVFYMNCDGDKRIARRLASMMETEKAARDRVAMQCVEMQMEHEDVAVDYSGILDKAIEENGWDGSDRAIIEQAITRKLNYLSRKMNKENTPILDLLHRKNMPRRERERAKRYLIGIGWEGPEE